MLWATKQLEANRTDEGFYRISGVKGAGKSHLTKISILDMLREVETNPDARLIIYEPKREFYAWMCSLGLKSHVTYFMPSDTRGVALDFTRDYPDLIDDLTLAQAFHPIDPHEHQKFFGDAVRTIYAQVFAAIKGQLGYATLRLMCHVIEDDKLTQAVLGHDDYFVQARKLLTMKDEKLDDTSGNILKSVHSRIAQMKFLAAHLDAAEQVNGLFSLRDFVEKPNAGVLVVSKHPRFRLVQDPMNGVLFLRLIQLLDGLQQKEKRKVFIVIDEFPQLAGELPCPGISDLFLLLRSRGVTVLITYQAQTTLRKIYGDTATDIIGQCTNVIYLRQADVESAEYASKDLGNERGFETTTSTGHGTGGGSEQPTSTSNVTNNPQWFDRATHTSTELLNEIPDATESNGVQGIAKSPAFGPKSWTFRYPPEFIGRIPKRHEDIEEYVPWPPEAQYLRPLTPPERYALETPKATQSEADFWLKHQND